MIEFKGDLIGGSRIKNRRDQVDLLGEAIVGVRVTVEYGKGGRDGGSGGEPAGIIEMPNIHCRIAHGGLDDPACRGSGARCRAEIFFQQGDLTLCN